jgi:hypothetical protein
MREAGKTPAEFEHVRQCYDHPESINLDDISWNLLSRPAPFVGNLPQPGEQAEGPFNKAQLRDARELIPIKPEGVYRVFVTGGSFAYGVGASDWTLAIPPLLESAANAGKERPDRTIEVWNAAVPAWASTHERIRIENHLSEWQPDLVVMLTGTNECHWAFGGLNILDLRTYSQDEYFTLTNFAMRIGGVEPHPLLPPWHEAYEPLPAATVAKRFVKNVRLAALALEPFGAELVVALQPSLSPQTKPLDAIESLWYERDKAQVDYFDQCFEAMAPALDTLAADGPANFHWISLRDAFADRPDAIYTDLYHIGDKGNRIVARLLADRLDLVEYGKNRK